MSKNENPQNEREKLSREETLNILTDAIAEAAIDRIGKMSERLTSEAAKTNTGNLDPKRADVLKGQLAPILNLGTQAATVRIEKAHKDTGPVLDSEALADFKANQGEYASKMAGFASNKDFSDGKKIAEQIESLKKEVNDFKDTLKSSLNAKEEVVEKEASNKISPADDLVKKPRGKAELSSIETWNLLVEKAAEVAHKDISRLSESSATMTLEMLAFQNEKYSREMQKTFEAELKSFSNEHKLDPKTVNDYKEKSEASLKEMLKNPKTVNDYKEKSEASLKEMSKIKAGSIKDKIDDFKTKTTIDPNDVKSGWKKVADFCKSAKMDRLAEFCNEKHIEAAAKKISKELDANLSKDHSKVKSDSNKKYYKPRGEDHGR